MRKIILIFTLLFIHFSVVCQNDKQSETQRILDSLASVTTQSNIHDTIKVEAYLDLTRYYYQKNPDTAIFFINKMIDLSKKQNYSVGLSDGYGWLGYLYAQSREFYIVLKDERGT